MRVVFIEDFQIKHLLAVAVSGVCRFHEEFFESGQDFGADRGFREEKPAAYDPAIFVVEFVFMLRVFESLFVGVQNLDVKFVCVSEFVEDMWDYIGTVVFAYAESVLAVAQIGIDPSEMRGIKWVKRHRL